MHQGPLEKVFNQIASPPPTHLRISGLMNGGGGAEILHFSKFPIAAAENLSLSCKLGNECFHAL